MKSLFAILSLFLIIFFGCSEREDVKMADEKEKTDYKNLETATFAAGCFWGVESTFQNLKGVKDTTVGYTGGHTENPTYKEVCSDKTGHAEAVQLKYDPNEISYEKLLEVFWKSHNPTTQNRQGPDIGSQYRSAIFYHNQKQKEHAIKSKDQLDKSGKYNKPVVTEITEATKFYPAEDYHQDYYKKRGLKSCPY